MKRQFKLRVKSVEQRSMLCEALSNQSVTTIQPALKGVGHATVAIMAIMPCLEPPKKIQKFKNSKIQKLNS